MIGIVVAAHGSLGAELVRTAERVVGPLPQCTVLGVEDIGEDDMQTRFLAAIAQVDSGDGVLILTDMFGGTPANLGLSMLSDKIEVLTGVNLPMLIKLATCRDTKLSDTARLIKYYGQKNISVASEFLSA